VVRVFRIAERADVQEHPRSHIDPRPVYTDGVARVVLTIKNMNWKWKARIQRACAGLPVIQEPAYYFLQRRFGSVQDRSDPFPMLMACARLARILHDAARPVAGARIMEVGTGRCINMPLGFYLCGASSVVTFDAHRYLKPPLLMAALDVFRAQKDKVIDTLRDATDVTLLQERLELLCSSSTSDELLRHAKIEYRAPADAADSGLEDHSIDIQISYTVFEHIPRQVLRGILLEARRVLAPDGVTLHHIDTSDHFSHHDRSILPINFLQYSDAEWARLAGNQFAYHNRLRANEFADLYSECGHEVLLWKPYVDEPSLRALANGFPVHCRFQSYSPDTLSTVVLQVLSRPQER